MVNYRFYHCYQYYHRYCINKGRLNTGCESSEENTDTDDSEDRDDDDGKTMFSSALPCSIIQIFRIFKYM